MSFIEYIVPEYDASRVYPSDIKKLVNWYKILLKESPDFFVEEKKKEKGKSDQAGKKEEKEDSTKVSNNVEKKKSS